VVFEARERSGEVNRLTIAGAVMAAGTMLTACGGGGGGAGTDTGPAPARAPAPIAYVPLTSTLPPIPEVDAPLAIRVIEPTQGSGRPGVDSTFIYGSVGTGDAALVINGTQVPVAPNGAFIAFLPNPRDAWRLTAYKGGQRAEATISYRAPGPRDTAATARPSRLPEGVFPASRLGVVTRGSDSLATGSDAVYARPTPTGPYRWFFPRGTRLTLVERRRAQYRVQLDTASAWIDTVAVRVEEPQLRAPARPVAEVRPSPDGAELRIAAGYAPFLVEARDNAVNVTVYRDAPASVQAAQDDFVRGATVTPAVAGGGAAQVSVSFSRAPWGYMATYEEDGTLVVRIRRPPAIDAANPLRGIRIVIDPGHPPAGATGPTGYQEKDANLAIALPLAEKLRARGAEVILTRTQDVPVELAPRTQLAVDRSAHLLISVHNNAFGEGQNPFRSHHTSAYYFQPWSQPLAAALNREIATVAGIPNRGALWGNLALVRPTWMPSALTESLFMPIPEQENALRDAAFVDRLAEAHVRGLEAFLRESANR
jgi:N-acetylmuramoyl-L-alanine amidase